MKKILSAITALCLLLSLVATLTSCAHECEFSTEWSKDETSHWHVCTKDDECIEISDKADHTWGDGEITTEPSQEADGVKTFTCTVCGQTKTESVKFTGMTEKEWNAAFVTDVFKNFAYKETSTTKGNGVTVDTEVIYRITTAKAHVKITAAGQTQQQTFLTEKEVKNLRNGVLDSIKELAKYKNFDYDAETKTYKANKAIYIKALKANTSDITLKFEDGKLVEIKYSVEFTQSNIKFTADSVITIYDYGKVSL